MQIDPSTLELPPPTEAFQVLEAFQLLVSTGPVFVGPHMEDPNHTNTKTPFVKYSPLVRLALAATHLGATSLVFDEEEIHTCVAAVLMFQPHTTPVMQKLETRGTPTLLFHWCELNSKFFIQEAMQSMSFPLVLRSTVNPSIVTHVLEINGTAKVDPKNPNHLNAIGQVLEYLKTRTTRVEKLEKELEVLKFLAEAPGPSWNMGEPRTAAVALEQVNATAQRWLDEAKAKNEEIDP